MRATGQNRYAIEVRNGKYIVIQEVDKVVTELSEHDTMQEAQDRLRELSGD